MPSPGENALNGVPIVTATTLGTCPGNFSHAHLWRPNRADNHTASGLDAGEPGVCDTPCTMDVVTKPQPTLEHPLRTLDPKAVPAWRLATGAAASFGLSIWVALLMVLHQTGAFSNVPVLIVLFLAGSAIAVMTTWYGPLIEWNHWRYDIRDEEIDLKSGMFTITCLLYTSDAADDLLCVDLGGR